jgi:hypothetical protein
LPFLADDRIVVGIKNGEKNGQILFETCDFWSQFMIDKSILEILKDLIYPRESKLWKGVLIDKNQKQIQAKIDDFFHKLHKLSPK